METENKAHPIFRETYLGPTYGGVKVEAEMIEVLKDQKDNHKCDNEDKEVSVC